MSYTRMTKEELFSELSSLRERYRDVCAQKLSLDMSRGKPCTEQLGLSDELLFALKSKDDCKTEAGFDIRNYGLPGGVPELCALFAELLGVPENNIILGGNSSLNMMYDTVCRAILSAHMVIACLGKTRARSNLSAPFPATTVTSRSASVAVLILSPFL